MKKCIKYCYKGKKYADLDAENFLGHGEKNMIFERGGGEI